MREALVDNDNRRARVGPRFTHPRAHYLTDGTPVAFATSASIWSAACTPMPDIQVSSGTSTT
ncbi:hypothetical protein AB0M45_03800 [Nocardia sp. NPDC051787]|uniref:hypothetical protein n=1 Tax=Nocardia sp. NPDC051787 TaxID=3155415 RepID=UPI0034188573